MYIYIMLSNNKLVKRIPIPTPYPIGDIYCYLIRDDPITVIDTGVNLPQTEDIWKQKLKEMKLSFKDIKRIVITHGHSDHYGFARRLSQLSGAPIYVHLGDWKKVKDRKGYYQGMFPYMGRYGIPPWYLDTFLKVLIWERNFCEDIKEGLVPLKDQDVLEFEHISLKVIHTPGHSLGHVILMHETEAFSGDFIFSTITSIPTLEFDEKGNRKKTVLMYESAIKRAKREGLKLFLPSHLEERGDFDEALRAMNERRRKKEEKILAFLKKAKRATPFEIMKELYPEHKKAEVYMLLSDIMGRLDLLEEKGLVKWEEENGKLLYCLSSYPTPA